MKRPILIAALGYIIGIVWGLSFKVVLIFCSIIAISMLIVEKNKNILRIIKLVINKKVTILLLIFIIAGFIHIKFLEYDYEKIYISLENVNIVGTIVSSKKEKQYINEYKIETEKINNIKLKKKFILLTKNKEIEYGNKIKLEGTYIKPSKSRNYRGFDYSNYLKTENIYGTIEQNGKIELIKEKNTNYLFINLYKVKNKIIKNINNKFPKETRGVFLGILLGDKNSIEEDVRQNFADSSLSHILAVSGTHISYVVICISVLFKKLKLNKNIRKVLTSLVLFMYLYLVDFSVSATRAVIMSNIVILQMLFYRKQDTITTIALSSIIILINNPYSILNIGFLLSYGGTIGIILFVNKISIESKEVFFQRFKSYLKDICIVTISAQTIIIPIIIYYFNTISFTFIISNIIASLIIGPIIMVGLVIIAISFFKIPIISLIIKIYNILIAILMKTADIISKIPISKIYLKTPTTLEIIFYYSVVFFIVLLIYIKKSNRKFIKKIIQIDIYNLKSFFINNRNKVLIFISIISLISITSIKIPKELKINFIDVGQGDSCLITTPQNKKVIVDSGGSESYDVGKNVLLPYLLDKRITNIDYIMISHFDTDHCKGFEYVLENIKVKNVIISKQSEASENFKQIMKIIRKKRINLIIVQKGSKIKIDNFTTVNIISPQSENIADNMNDNSIVAKLEAYNFSILFTGDASEKIEKELIKEKINLKSDILKVSHHGSRTGTSEEFLKSVKPKIALIGVGENNKFGHPTEDVIKRLTENKVKIYRTDTDGEISIKIKKNKNIKIKKHITN